MAGPPGTFADLLRARLAVDPGRPLVTFYDHRTGERTELSVATYANWVAKAAGLLVDEGGLERGHRLRVDLPTHWLGAVFLGAAWTAGLVVSEGPTPDGVVCGPESLAGWAAAAGDIPVLACSLRPLGVRFAEALPAGVHDVGVEVWSQPDLFVPPDPPRADDPALAGAAGTTADGREAAAVAGPRVLSQRDLVARAAGSGVLERGGRLLTTRNPAGAGALELVAALAREGSLVLVANPDQERLPATYAAERATARTG